MTPRREEWLSPPPGLHLGADEVHVWRASTAVDAAAFEAFWPTLAPEEKRRAEAFHFDRDRRRYVLARGVLRDILARYLETSPAHVRLTYGEYGKPALAEGREELCFNVSHSHDAALYACARVRELGVDIEMLRADFASLEIAGHFFSAAEVRELRSLPEQQRTQAFFNCWTRKEAYVKALGSGLSHPLSSFAVSLTPGDPARLISTDEDPREAAEWSIIDLNPFQGYAAALAVRDRSPKLHLWDWRPEGGA